MTAVYIRKDRIQMGIKYMTMRICSSCNFIVNINKLQIEQRNTNSLVESD